MCNLGFSMSYIVFIKILVPKLIVEVIYGDIPDDSNALPWIIGTGPYSG